MEQIFEYLMSTPFGPYVMALAMVAFFITHLVPHLPPEWTSKIPDWLMKIINSLAGQYKHAQNKETDINGNRRY